MSYSRDKPIASDAGSDTFRRFRYQAEVAVPYCLACAMDLEGIAAVVPEYLEDIALDCGALWRFLQVKSRNPELGLWTLGHLLEKRGALRSLYRTYLCLRDRRISLELVLEGAPKSKDPIVGLRRDESRSVAVPVVAVSLRISEETAADFLSRVVLNAPPPPRDYIAASNRDLIHTHAPHLSTGEVVETHRQLVDAIEQAMRAERLGPLWPRYAASPERRSSEATDRIRAKTLSVGFLRGLLKSLEKPARPLLRHLVQPGTSPLSVLHRKMIEGGGTAEVIAVARNLQANATQHHFLRSAQGRPPKADAVADLHQRIEAHVTARVALHSSGQHPALQIWAALLELFEARAGSIDPNSVLAADPLLLLGEACLMSDQCKFGWGTARDAN